MDSNDSLAVAYGWKKLDADGSVCEKCDQPIDSAKYILTVMFDGTTFLTDCYLCEPCHKQL